MVSVAAGCKRRPTQFAIDYSEDVAIK